MGHYHQVGPGETCGQSLLRMGFRGVRYLGAANNPRPTESRSPGTLEPGDEVWIPADASAPVLPAGSPALCRSGSSHCFTEDQVRKSSPFAGSTGVVSHLPAGATN